MVEKFVFFENHVTLITSFPKEDSGKHFPQFGDRLQFVANM